MVTARSRELPIVGWREWVALPAWGVPWTKAKIDTGARTSAMHAFDLERFEQDDVAWVRFVVHPWQRSAADGVVVESPLVGSKEVRSSSGAATQRPVVRTTIRLAGITTDVDVTLTRRDEMGFRMLIGRQALRGRFVVDPARSYAGGKPPIDMRRRNRDPGR
jgi:hypothetical protein